MRWCLKISCVLIVWLSVTVAKSQSLLRSGTWYKVAVSQPGVYKIDYSTFRKMGFDPAKTDPRKIRIAGNKGGMLPQPNSTPRPAGLTELAIFVNGENDDVFNSSDYILFYAQGADRYDLNPMTGLFSYEQNLYDSRNYYFISVGESNGKRITTQASEAGTFPEVTDTDNFYFHELESYSELKSGREWFGERFETTLVQSFDIPLPSVVANSSITVTSDVMAQSFLGSSFTVSLNGTALGTQAVSAIPNTPYGEKGSMRRDVFTVNESTVSATGKATQQLTYQYNKATSGRSVGFLNRFLVQVKQLLRLTGHQTHFRSLSSLTNTTSTFRISESVSDATVWKITNPYEPQQIATAFTSGATTFSLSTNDLHEFVIFTTNVPAPTLIGKVANQDLASLPTPNLIIVTATDFVSAAQRLADHRAQVSGWSTHVVTYDQICIEYASGRRDITAIRDFVKSLYDKSPGTLKALLLFGKTSYDYKNLSVDNINFLPTYESRNSLHPLQTYSSDDYFGFLENSEGNWGESPVENHTLDIGVGRLPVKTITEANDVVDKIIAYETSMQNAGAWRKTITYVADDGNSADGYTSIHQDQANDLAEFVESTSPQFNTRKIFIGTYQKVVGAGGETIPEANAAVLKAFNEGSLIINFTGHGSERVWCDERIFDDLTIGKLENKFLPFLVTATCEFGRQDDPIFISSAEQVVLRKNAGAIGLVTTARPVNSSTNFSLNEAFYEAFVQTENNRYQTIGEIFRQTKNNSISGVANRNFSLMGDPSLTLLLPQRTLQVNQITTTDGSTTLKALSRVIVTGEVRTLDDQPDEDFQGTLTATLFDKQTNFVTIGRNNPPYQFKQWYNALFRGKASVIDGQFTFEFIVPKNIAYQVDGGKLSLYAYDDTRSMDATGSSENFDIGSSQPDPVPDNTSPEVRAYIGDETFVNGGHTSAKTNLFVSLKDVSGITISGYGIGNSIIGILDDSETYILNDYYTGNVDNFTQGTIVFPLTGLSPGKHAITVKAWDTYNNPGEGTVEFYVTDGNALQIEFFSNYPNPFDDKSMLFFRHNRPGDDLVVDLTLYSRTGEIIYATSKVFYSSNYEVSLLEIDLKNDSFKKLTGGLYFARVIARSLSNGSKNEHVTKLIIPN